MVIPPLELDKTLPFFTKQCWKLLAEGEDSKMSLGFSHNKLQLGKRGSKMLLVVQPDISRNVAPGEVPVVSQLGLDVCISGISGQQLFLMMSSKTSSVDTYFASVIINNLRGFDQFTPILQHVKSSLKSKFNVDSVVLPTSNSTHSGKVPRQLRSAVSSCTTLFNKLDQPANQAEVKQILIDKLFKRIALTSKTIVNYETFVKEVITILKASLVSSSD